MQPHPLPAAISNKETPCYASLGPRWHAASCCTKGPPGFRVFRSPRVCPDTVPKRLRNQWRLWRLKVLQAVQWQRSVYFLRLFRHLWRHIREMLGKEVAEPQKVGKLNAIEQKALSLYIYIYINCWLAINSCLLIVFSLTVDSNFCLFVISTTAPWLEYQAARGARGKHFGVDWSAEILIFCYGYCTDTSLTTCSWHPNVHPRFHYAIWHWTFVENMSFPTLNRYVGCFQK